MVPSNTLHTNLIQAFRTVWAVSWSNSSGKVDSWRWQIEELPRDIVMSNLHPRCPAPPSPFLCTYSVFYFSHTKGFSGNSFYKGLPLVTTLVSLFMPLKGLRRRKKLFAPCYKGKKHHQKTG